MQWNYLAVLSLTAGLAFAQETFTDGCFGKPPATLFTASASVSGKIVTVTITPQSGAPLTGYSVVWGDGTLSPNTGANRSYVL